ncbi:MAG: hypothetical protein HC880_15320 [Bacteroidia bacterium]|nr:hypothetical protein [Bacteroidia bacterium]
MPTQRRTRRLFYVALTGTLDVLEISSAAERMRYGKTIPQPASRFVDELPPAELEFVAVREKKEKSPSRGGSALFVLNLSYIL